MTDSFVKGLFGGAALESMIFPYPAIGRPEVDQVFALVDGVRRVAERVVDPETFDREASIPEEVWVELRSLGALGLLVPVASGGVGLGQSGAARCLQELAYFDLSLSLAVSAHTSLATTAILLFGTESAKNRWLPDLATGKAIAAFALTEAGAGSDAAAIKTRAEWDPEREQFALSGTKSWVTNGNVADVFVVFARTSPAEDGAKPRLTAFVVPRGPGVAVGKSEGKLGVRGASTTNLHLDRVCVGEDHVLGSVGRGFKVATEVLTHARLGLAAACVGASKRLLRMSVERVNERKTFGRSIGEFGLVRDKIATMATSIFALESMTYLTTSLADRGEDFVLESAIGKVFGSETLWYVANEACQIAGAAGYMDGSGWERLLRDARAPMIVQGTNEILRCFIALSGMQGPSRDLEGVSWAMREPIKGFGLLTEFAKRHAKSVLGRESASQVHPGLSAEWSLVEHYAAQLAKTVDKVLRRHGGNISEMQYTQRRAAEMAIDLYAVAALVTRASRAAQRRGDEGARRELDMTRVFAAGARKRLADCVATFEDNDDELRKAIAQKTCDDGGYPLDIF